MLNRFAGSKFAGPLLIAALGLAVYAPTLGYPFVWDDEVLLGDQAADRLRDIPAIFTRDYFQVTSERTWRPLATLVYALLALPFGAKPWLLRGASLGLHVLNALLVWRLARDGLAGASAGRGATRREFAAVVAAAWFVAHPVQVETVVQVTFNEDLLVTAAILGAVFAWRRRAAGWCAAAFAGGLLSKESALVLPPLLLAHDLCLERLPPWRAVAGRARGYAALAVVAAAYAVLRFGWFVNPAESAGRYLGGSPMMSVLTMGQAAMRGLALLLAPWPLRILHLVPVPASPATPGVALALAGAAAWAWAAWRLRAYPADRPGLATLGLVWAPVTMVPILNVIPFLAVPGIGERYLYTGSAGLAMAVAAAASAPPARAVAGEATRAAVPLAACLVAAWGGLSAARARVWSEPMRFYETVVAEVPTLAVPRLGLGKAYLKAGRAGDARTTLMEARRLNPRDGAPAELLGVIAFRGGRAAEALTWLDEAVRLGSRNPAPYFNRGVVLETAGRTPEALESFRASFRLNPRDPKTAYAIGKILVKSGGAQDAIPFLEVSVRRAARDSAAWQMLGLALVGAGRPQEGWSAYERARALGLDSAGLHNNIGIALRMLGRDAEARAAFLEALRRDPRHREARLNLRLLPWPARQPSPR